MSFRRGCSGGCPGPADGPHKTLYNRCRRWSDKGVFELIFSELSASDAPEPPGSAEPPDAPEPAVLMIDATDVKAHPTVSSLNKGAPPPDWLYQGVHDQQAP